MLSLVLALLAAPQEAPTVQVQMTRPEMYFEGSLLPMQGCADGTSDTAHFVIGDQRIHVPRASVKTFLPQQLKMAGEPPHDFETGDFLLPTNMGCAEAETALITLALDVQAPGLPRGVGLRAGRFATDEEVASWRDGGHCNDVGDGYRLCAMRFRQDQPHPTAVLISQETSRDGGPLFAICEVKPDFVPEPGSTYIPFESMVCTVEGTRGGMIYSVDLGEKPMIDNMRAADNAVTEWLDRIL